MLTKNMKHLIQEVKKEMRRARPTGYDLNDKLPSPKTALSPNKAVTLVTPSGTKRTAVSGV